MHTPSSRTGVDNAGFLDLLIPTGVRMAEEDIIVGVGLYESFEVRLVVTVQNSNFPAGHRKMRHPPHEVDSGIFGKYAQLLLEVAISQYGINRNVQSLQKLSHFSENHVGSDIAAMNNGINRPEDEFTGGG